MKKSNKQTDNEPKVEKINLLDKLEAYLALLVLAAAAFRGIQLQVTNDENVAIAIASVVVVFCAISIAKVTKR